MRCKGEGCRKCRKNKLNRAKCWSKWGICGSCAVKKYPQEYRKKVEPLKVEPLKVEHKYKQIESNYQMEKMRGIEVELV